MGKDSKIINILSICFTVILFAGNTFNGDYNAYLWRYDSGQLEAFGRGFVLLANVCRDFSLTYNQFLAVICIPCYVAIYFVNLKFSSNFCVFIALYYSILVFYDINQIRNFIVATLLLIALYFLSQGRKIAFIFCVIIAATFHSIALIYLLVLFFDKERVNNKNTILFATLLSIGASVVVKALQGRYYIVRSIIFFLSSRAEKSVAYTASVINFGVLIPIAGFFCSVFLVVLGIKYLKKYNGYEKYTSIISVCYSALVLSLITLPLNMIDLTFDRILRNFNFLFYIFAGIVIKNFEDYKNENTYIERDHSIKVIVYKDQIFYFIFLCAYSLIWTVGTIMRYNGFEILESSRILNNNIFFR